MTEHETHPHLALAARLERALVSGDLATVEAVYADDIVVFRNFDARELPKSKVMKVVGFLATSVDEFRYENVRVTPTADGFVQQHVFRGRAKSGAEIAAHVCLVARVRDGRITRIDEYLDSAQMAPLMGG